MPEKMRNPGELPEEALASDNKTKMENEEAFYKWLFENGEKPEHMPEEEIAEAELADEEKYESSLSKRWDEGVEKLKSKYLNTELSKETKDDAESILEKEEEKTKIDYVKQWLGDNKPDETKYPQTKGMTEESLISFAITDLKDKENPFYQLENGDDEENKKKYGQHVEKALELHILHEGIKKDSLDPEAQFLALDFFYKKAKEASKEFHNKEKEPDKFSEKEIENAKKEWFKQSRIVKELTEKFTGKDPEEQAEKDFDASAEKEKTTFVNDRLARFDTIKSKQYTEILKALGEEDLKKSGMVDVRGKPIKIDITKDFSYDSKVGPLSRDQVVTIVKAYGVEGLRDIKHKFLSNKVLIGKVEVKTDLDGFLNKKKEEMDKKMREELQDAAEIQWKKSKREMVGKKFDEIIKGAISSEKAKETIKDKFKNAKNKLFEQWQKEKEEWEKDNAAKKAESKPESEDAEKLKMQDSILKLLALSEADQEKACLYLKDHITDIHKTLKDIAGLEIKEENLLKYAEDPKKLNGFLRGCLIIIGNAV